jgi:Flp pilus assembly protein TadB
MPSPVVASAARAAVSPNPAPAKIPQPPAQQLDELQLVPQDETPPQDKNLEAIQRAARQRFSKMPASRPASKGASPSARSPVGGGQLAKGMGKIPLSLAISIACMLGVIVIWVVIAKITGLTIGYVVIGVPVAGAWGLTRLTERRSIMLGLLAAGLGLGGMLAGHVAIAKWVIVPGWEKDKEYNAAKDKLQQKFSNDFAALPSDPQQWQTMAANEQIMIHVAAWDLVDSGRLDKNIFNKMYFVEKNAENIPGEIKTARDQAQTHLKSWSDAQRIEALKKHFDALRQNYEESIQSKIRTGVKAATFVIAFLASFGLLDLLWFLMGLGGAFKLAAGVGGE